jgi:hypothetical protein
VGVSGPYGGWDGVWEWPGWVHVGVVWRTRVCGGGWGWVAWVMRVFGSGGGELATSSALEQSKVCTLCNFGDLSKKLSAVA